jgi:FixJ family two-component response regulator
MLQASAIVVVRDPVLASALELALLAAGLTAIIREPTGELDDLPLDEAMTLIIDQQLMAPTPLAFLAALRRRPWLGLVILITGDRDALSPALLGAHRVTVLEMPFQGADLIAAVRAAWPEGGDGSTPDA